MEPFNDNKDDNDNEDDKDCGCVLWLPSDQGGSCGPPGRLTHHQDPLLEGLQRSSKLKVRDQPICTSPQYINSSLFTNRIWMDLVSVCACQRKVSSQTYILTEMYDGQISISSHREVLWCVVVSYDCLGTREEVVAPQEGWHTIRTPFLRVFKDHPSSKSGISQFAQDHNTWILPYLPIEFE